MLDLVGRAFARVPYTDPGSVAQLLFDYLLSEDPLYAVLVALRENHGIGLAVLSGHVSPLTPFPFFLHFFAEKGAKIPLARAAFEWYSSQGYDRVWSVNATPLPDAEWMKLFDEATPGPSPTPIATIWEFTRGDVS